MSAHFDELSGTPHRLPVTCVTLDLDTRFTGQAKVGEQLIAEGRVVTAGRNIFFARGEVKDGAGNLVAFGASTHRYRSGSHAPEGIPLEGRPA